MTFNHRPSLEKKEASLLTTNDLYILDMRRLDLETSETREAVWF